MTENFGSESRNNNENHQNTGQENLNPAVVSGNAELAGPAGQEATGLATENTTERIDTSAFNPEAVSPSTNPTLPIQSNPQYSGYQAPQETLTIASQPTQFGAQEVAAPTTPYNPYAEHGTQGTNHEGTSQFSQPGYGDSASTNSASTNSGSTYGSASDYSGTPDYSSAAESNDSNQPQGWAAASLGSAPENGQAGYGSSSYDSNSYGSSGYGSASYNAPAPASSYPSAYNSGHPTALAPAVTANSRAEAKPKKKVGMGLFVGSVAAAALVAALIGGGTASLFGGQNATVASSNSQGSAPLVINNTNSVNQTSAAAAKAMPSVVTISASQSGQGGTGSGIILDQEGHILTNTHVVTLDGAAANAVIEVQLSNGKVYAGKIVGTDPLSDLAVVKIEAPNLTPATLGNSSKLNVGDSVIAIGSPLGLNATVTEGIVSTLNRTIQVASSAVKKDSSDSSSQSPDNGQGGFKFSPPNGSSSNTATGTVNLNVIQTDAAINPGNSGGALVNGQGQIVGVNVAIASTGSSSSSTSQSGNIGVGFSIPIDHAKRVANEIIANGKATHGQLGVSVSGTSALGNSSQFSAGATVAEVTSGGAADKAGIQKGDVITKLGDRIISDASSLTAAVREDAANQKVTVILMRDGKELTKEVTLGAAVE